MHASLEKLCEELRSLADSIRKASNENRTLTESYGWNCPAVTRHDLAGLADSLALSIEQAGVTKLSDDEDDTLQSLPKQIAMLKQHTIPQLFNGGNVPHAAAAYIATLTFLQKELEPYYAWQRISDASILPPKLAKKVRACAARLAEISPELDSLDAKVERILNAHDAAESLPTDMEALDVARKKIDRIAEESVVHAERISSRDGQSEKTLHDMIGTAAEAQKILLQCEEAYRAATSKGLASAFDARAKALSASMWAWVAGLVGALIVGSWLGSNRVSLLSDAISAASPHWGSVWMHVALSVLIVGAPLWFAWLATKQIGQRFRLAEDYAFKASVAKAYEGYRKEAARIDEVFEARLFSSALSRLEEAPLRLVEGTTHGSPWHELMTSPAFQEAIETVPKFRDTLVDILKRGAETVTTSLTKGSPKKAPEQEPAD